MKDFMAQHTERVARKEIVWREDLLKSLAPPDLRDDTKKTIEFLTENSVGFVIKSGCEYLFMQGHCLGRVTSSVTTEKNITRLSMAFDPNDRVLLDEQEAARADMLGCLTVVVLSEA